MSKIQKFINISEKLMIAATILAYIPTTILVFLPSLHSFLPEQILAYRSAYTQLHTAFVVGPNL